MPDTEALNIDDLYYSAINVQSTNFNFGAGYSETWEDVPLSYFTCPTCDFVGDGAWELEDCPHCNGGTILERPEVSPMMNYRWELPGYGGDPESDQLRLYQSRVNMVLIKIIGGEDAEDEYALALSGGGMNLAWDIAQAYILLGYVPPITLYDSLPLFAGQDNSQEPFASVLKACFQGLENSRNRLIWAEKKLLDVQAWTGQ